MLSRDAILQADDLTKELVAVPEWGGDVYVRVMSGAEKGWWESQLFTEDGEAISRRDQMMSMRAITAVATVCDEQGAPLFTLADAPLLAQKSAAALDRIWDVARRLNRISQAEEDALLKNSDAGQNVGSGSASP